MLSPKRDMAAAKHFPQIALWRTGQILPCVLNVDGRPSYPSVIAELNKTAN